MIGRSVQIGGQKLSAAILPFAARSDVEEKPGLGSDIAGRLRAKMMPDARFSVGDPDDVAANISAIAGGSPAGSDRTGLRVGRLLGVSLVIRGTYQVKDDTLTLDARLLDVSAGKAAFTGPVTVSGDYPGGLAGCIEKLAVAIDTGLRSTATNADRPSLRALPPFLHRPTLEYKRVKRRSGEPVTAGKSVVSLYNHSPFDAEFDCRGADGLTYPVRRVAGRSSVDVTMPSKGDLLVVVSGRGGSKGVRYQFEEDYNAEIAYDAQAGVLAFENNSGVAINVVVTSGGASIGLSLDPGQKEELRVSPGQYTLVAKAAKVANRLERALDMQAGDVRTTTYAFD